MIVIGESIAENKIKVSGLYSRGSEIKDIGEVVMPPSEHQPGKIAELYCNTDTGELFYEYVDRPLTQDELVQVQQQEIEQLKLMVADLGLMAGGGL